MTQPGAALRPCPRTGGLVALVVAVLLSLAGPAHAASVTDLGTLIPSGLNARDQVVGDIVDPNNPSAAPHAGLWSGGTLTPLPEQSNASQSDALAINATGRIAGDDYVPSSGGNDVHALFWNAAGPRCASGDRTTTSIWSGRTSAIAC